mmetsp:Transcript_86212/g.180365  ORF Transcript_86212/g.180365 Transcript_86212/m.180365 type:complete len:205 (-) Transcript_86212:333-947(-)
MRFQRLLKLCSLCLLLGGGDCNGLGGAGTEGGVSCGPSFRPWTSAAAAGSLVARSDAATREPLSAKSWIAVPKIGWLSSHPLTGTCTPLPSACCGCEASPAVSASASASLGVPAKSTLSPASRACTLPRVAFKCESIASEVLQVRALTCSSAGKGRTSCWASSAASSLACLASGLPRRCRCWDQFTSSPELRESVSTVRPLDCT